MRGRVEPEGSELAIVALEVDEEVGTSAGATDEVSKHRDLETEA